MCVLLLQGRYLLNCGACQWEFSALSTKLKVVSPFDHFLLSVGEIPINCSKRKSLVGIKWMLCCAIARDVANWGKAEEAFLSVKLAILLNCTFKIPPRLCFFRAIWAGGKLFFSWWNKMAASSYGYPHTAVPSTHSTWHFSLWWQGCRVLFIPNAYSCCLKLPLIGISARLCSKKNWREPNALNLWNSGCPEYDFY